MTVDEVVVIGSDPVDEVKEFTVEESVIAPPISLWKVGAVLLAITVGGTGVYYIVKRGGGK
jgi:hypothetical protein